MFKLAFTLMILAALFTPRGALAQTYDSDADDHIVYEQQALGDGYLTLNVPRGWQAQMGLYDILNFSAPGILVSSPDEKQFIAFGVFEPPVYIEPADGAEEGETVTYNGFRLEVRDYVPADEFYKT